MRHRDMLAHLERLLKNHYDTKTPITPAYAGQIAAEIGQQLERHKGVVPVDSHGKRRCQT